MQLIPTEVGPVSACPYCGDALSEPDGPPSYVYGVGAVGYQSCESCGAKWRYLWHEPKSARRVVSLPYVLVACGVVLVAFGVIGFIGSRSSTPSATALTRPTTSHPALAFAAKPVASSTATNDYARIFVPMIAARAALTRWLTQTAPASSQIDVDQRLDEFDRIARRDDAALTEVKWPAPADSDVRALLRADRAFVGDLDLLRHEQVYSASYIDRLVAEAAALRSDAFDVRRDLGL